MDHAYYESSYYQANSSQDTVGMAVLSIYLIILALVLIFSLVSYILHSIGLYTIAGRLGMRMRGLHLFRSREPGCTVNWQEKFH